MTKNLKILFKGIYIISVIIRYQIRKLLFNTEYANKLFISIDKKAVIHLIKFCKGKIGTGCTIETPLFIHRANKDLSNLEIGNNTSISKNSFIDLSSQIKIGNRCTLAMEVMIITHTHYGNSNFCNYTNQEESVIIDDNVYIGARTTILKGIHIQKNSIIGACSLVNKNTESNSIYVGTPATKIKVLN